MKIEFSFIKKKKKKNYYKKFFINVILRLNGFY